MKKRKITYGVWGMMEYVAVVSVGRRGTKIQFSDGSVSAMGVNPARFSTDSIILQNAIERSDDFRRGLIKVVSVQELGGEVQVLRNKPKAVPRPELKPTSEPELVTEPELMTEPVAEPEPEAQLMPVECSLGVDDEEPSEDVGQQSETPVEEAVEVEFANKEEARDYLADTWGANRAKLRTRDDIIAAAKNYNVNLRFV